jgi:FixJ family two-component response regulator
MAEALASETFPPSLETAAVIRSFLQLTVYPSNELIDKLIADEWNLTPRELEVLFVVAHFPGEPNKTLAAGLGITKDGVAFHLGNICDKAVIPPGPDRRTALISKYLASKAATAVFLINISATLIERLNKLTPADPYLPS